MGNLLKRLNKWDTKYNVERIAGILTEYRPKMKANVEAVFPEIVMMEAQVRQVLDGESVATIDYPFYLNFGREVWSKLRAGFSGDSLAREVNVLMQKWVARGLAQPVLEAIRSQVFNIPAPGP